MVIEFLGIDQCGDSTVVVSVKKGREFLGIDQCGGDSISPTPTPTPTSTATPTPTPSPTATPTPSTTPSITPSPSNLGVAFSVIGSAGDLNSLCDKTTVFPVFVHAPESASNADNCQNIPTRFYTNAALTVPFNGQDRYYKKACPALGTYKVLVFSIGTNGVRGGLFEENCLPYVTPSPTVSLTPSITPSPSPSQTPDASCNFTFEIILPGTTPTPTPTPTNTPTPTPSITPSPSISASAPAPVNSPTALTIYGGVSDICFNNGGTFSVWASSAEDANRINICSGSPSANGIRLYTDSSLLIPFNGASLRYSNSAEIQSDRCYFEISDLGFVAGQTTCP